MSSDEWLQDDGLCRGECGVCVYRGLLSVIDDVYELQQLTNTVARSDSATLGCHKAWRHHVRRQLHTEDARIGIVGLDVEEQK